VKGVEEEDLQDEINTVDLIEALAPTNKKILNALV
jgi:hypothetical protein